MGRPIDFQERYRGFVQAYTREHPELGEDEAEDLADELFEKWVQQPADWLNGVSPHQYFHAISDPGRLVDEMEQYVRADMDVPDLLLERLSEMGQAAAGALNRAYLDEKRPGSVRSIALMLLSECGDAGFADKCVAELLKARSDSEISDIAAEILSWECDDEHVKTLLEGFPRAGDFAKMLILEVVCNFPGDERIYTYAVERLFNDPENRAIYAADLAKLGDERAVEPLRRLLGLSDLTYYDYMELCDAIEALGGEVIRDRTFYGDPDFEAMRNL